MEVSKELQAKDSMVPINEDVESENRKRPQNAKVALASVIILCMLLLGAVFWAYSNERGPFSQQKTIPSHSVKKQPSVDPGKGSPVLNQAVDHWEQLAKAPFVQQLMASDKKVKISLGVGVALIFGLVVSVVVVLVIRSRPQPELPFVSPPDPQLVLPKRSILLEISKSSGLQLMLFVAAGLCLAFLVGVQLFYSLDSKHGRFFFQNWSWLLLSLSGFLTVIALVGGLWQVGAFAQLTVLRFLNTAAVHWSLVACVVWICLGCYRLFGLFGSSDRLAEEADDKVQYLKKVEGAMKALVVALFFGMMGCIGGFEGVLGATVLAFLVVMTTAVFLKVQDARTWLHYLLGAVSTAIMVVAVGAVFFAGTNGVAPALIALLGVAVSALLQFHVSDILKKIPGT